jgi:hypothetical protein
MEARRSDYGGQADLGERPPWGSETFSTSIVAVLRGEPPFPSAVWEKRVLLYLVSGLFWPGMFQVSQVLNVLQVARYS